MRIKFPPALILNNQDGIIQLPIFILIAILAIGSGTAVLSDSSAPGDVLYGVDRGIEDVWLGLINDQENEIEFKVKLAEERLEEVEKLAGDSEREDDLEDALDSYREERDDIEERVDLNSSVFRELLSNEQEFLNFMDSFEGKVEIEFEVEDGKLEIEIEFEDEGDEVDDIDSVDSEDEDEEHEDDDIDSVDDEDDDDDSDSLDSDDDSDDDQDEDDSDDEDDDDDSDSSDSDDDSDNDQDDED